ncbi:kinase-like protein [Gigaspora margarita]|uniref:Kinase-like protein n=1 Tax=Gigaspora margarita TaxID=4874 RepID=A0A8H4EW27_GIGMA|nr:kinase-like protein [Gigaspora margarita]
MANVKIVAQLEEAISSQHINNFNYSEFTDFVEIGDGGFGEVYKCKWKDLRITVVLKNLNVNDNKFQIVQELKILQKVSFHPNIIQFYGVTKSSNGDYYMILQFAEDEIILGLNFLHKCNIVHRNLSTKSIFVHEGKMMIAYSVPNSICNQPSRKDDTDKTKTHGMPEIPNQMPKLLLQIISQCCDPEPAQRPKFKELKDKLNHLHSVQIEKVDSKMLAENKYQLSQISCTKFENFKKMTIGKDGFTIVYCANSNNRNQNFDRFNSLKLIHKSENYLEKFIKEKTYCDIGLEIPTPKSYKLAICPNVFNHLNLSSGNILPNDLKIAYIADLELSKNSLKIKADDHYLFGMFIWEILIHSKELPSAAKIYEAIIERQSAEK